MIFIEVFNYSFLFVGGGLVGYHLLISLLALCANKNLNHKAVKIRKFAVILFNYAEKPVLSRSIYSLSGLVYPKNKYDLIVIADSYSDSIVQLAEQVGAKIIVPSINERNVDKNIILARVFDSILGGGDDYDGIAIFDSEGLVSGNYLEVMNYHLEQGSSVVQCSYNNLDNSERWIDKIYEVDFLIDRLIYPMGRTMLGLGTTLQNSGICFSTSLLRKYPWNIEHQPNILEYGLDLRVNGIEIDFTSAAVIFTKVFPASNDKSSYSSSFITGKYQRLRKYMSLFLRRTAKTKALKYVDILLELVRPRFSTLMIFIVIISITNAVLWALGWISLSVLLLWILTMGIAVTSVAVVLKAADAKQKLLKSVMYIPITIFKKVHGFLKKKNRPEQISILAPDEKDKSFAVSDDNHSIQ